ncbi:hypothetical protein NQ314_002792 [Rhamnusium bicolor]|uniref:Glycoprotein-N-acetylgalactosamine 3-beta-galactosyltransferase 1-like n=1 Tax=Rhamnusium bicolor TaxID=1586634 RepID=A0AAV8ZQT0_9CUCU|nr:hypothetical protein NQ314_002792 [Rhamnusium bicolor]
MVHFYLRLITFFIGVIIGVLLAIKYKNYVVEVYTKSEVSAKKHIPSYNTWLESQRLKRKDILWDILRYKRHDYMIESHFLYSKIKVLCIILVRNSRNVKAIENTWGRGCNNIKLIEVNAKNKVIFGKRNKESSSWVLLCKTLKNINYEYDWVLIANDNTFFILENLRYYVASLKSSKRYYMGYAVKFWDTVYNSGEAGYVISKGTVYTFNKHFMETDCSTNTYWNREDFYLGKYLSKLNITPIDTRDSEGLSTFHPYNWYHVFFPGENYYKTSIFPVQCCSKNSISFQAIEGDKMYTYYYLLYTLQIFVDGKFGNRPSATQIPDEQVWKQFLKERNVPSDNITSIQYFKIWENLVDDPSSFAALIKKEVHFDYD